MITIINNNVSSTEGKFIQRKGGEFLGIHNCQARIGDTVDDWIEVDEAPAYTENEYKQKVQELISQRYSIEDELAIINNARDNEEEHIAELNEYLSYRLECKAKAKEELINRNSDEQV